ncbi:MAG TPA: GNAT family N-acetyltransferase [bacterium]|nr:GNAT family N-acetyltransferase [bacterium]
MAEAEINAQEIEFRREALTSVIATALILALNAELIARYPEDRTADHFELDADEVAPGRGVFLVAYAGSRPLACGAIRLLDADTAEVKRMYVEPGARGYGLGRRLLRALEAEAQLLGARRIVLETGPRQPEAIALYLRAGFSKIAAFGEYANSPLSVFMGKDL